MAKLSEKSRQRLYEEFDTMDILHALDSIDKLRGLLSDEENFRPPEIRENLFKLHDIAFHAVNQGLDDQDDLWVLAVDLEDFMDDLIEEAERVREVLTKLTSLMPDPDDEEGDDEKEDD